MTTQTKQKNPQINNLLSRLFIIIPVIFLLSVLAVVGASVFATAMSLNCAPTNGCFQVLNPLRRLLSGQIIGKDFNFFYGPGTILIHYPFYKLFGASLLASEATKIVLSPLLFLLSSWLVLKTAIKNQVSVIYWLALISAVASFGFSAVLFDDGHLASVRSFLPVMIASLFFLNKKITPTSWFFWLFIGLLSGMAFFVSPEQGVASLIAIFAVLSITQISLKQKISAGLILLFTFIVTSLLLGFASSGRWVIKLFTYHIFDVRLDQFWLFGSSPGGYINSFADIFTIPSLVAMIVITMLIGLVIAFAKNISNCQKNAFTYLLFYGLLSTIPILGYIRPEYFHKFFWVVGLIIVILIQTKIKSALQKNIVLFVGLILIGGAFIVNVIDVSDKFKTSAGVKKFSGVNLPVEWAWQLDVVQQLIKKDNSTIWSTFAGLPEATYNQFNPATDYIFHSSGKNRSLYATEFAEYRPSIVRTTDNKTHFEYWLSSAYWDFYERLLLNYEYVDQNKNGAIWVRTANDWLEPSNDWIELSDYTSTTISWPTDIIGPAVMVVEVDYDINNSLSGVPIVGDLARYVLLTSVAGDENIYRPLPPYDKQHRFPLYLEQDEVLESYTLTVSGPHIGARASLTGVRFKLLPTSVNNLNFFLKQTDYNAFEE